MASKGAPLGNKNASHDKPWQSALNRALAQYENKAKKVNRGEALRRVADTVVEQAIDGNKDAWLEIGNRLDGKAPQAITGADGGSLIVEMVKFANTDTR